MQIKTQKTDSQPILFAFGVNHKTTSIQVREKIYVRDDEVLELLGRFKETLSECMILSTCNRTEIYGVHPTGEVNFDFYKNLLIDFKNASGTVSKSDFFSFVSCAACQQLFHVATSVDSKIIGDTQILQQLRKSYLTAKDGNFTSKILDQLLQRSLKIGKQTYTQTAIHKGAVSISLAAVDLALKTYGTLHDKNILIIGAGETAQLTAECLLKLKVGKLSVTNRTAQNARYFLHSLHKSYDFESEIIDFDHFREHLNKTDIVITSTSSPKYILSGNDFEKQNRKILLIDIALPRDIAPETAENGFVTLKNIDDLHSVINQNFKKRMAEMAKVKKIIYGEMGDFLVWYYSQPLLPASFKSGQKPDAKSIEEIKKIKEFLAANASWFHKMARQTNVKDELSEHKNLIKHLFAMKQNALGEANFEK